MITFKPEWRITWYVAPLDESPETVEFDLWNELEDWISDKESTCDCFDLDLCLIERIGQ